MKFKKIQLDNKAIDYVKTILKEMKIDDIFESVNFSKGQVYTYLPLNVKREAINKFEQGGILPEPDEKIYVEGGYFVKVPTDIYICLAEEIYRFLNANSKNICILRTGWAKKSDEFLKSFKELVPMHFYNNFVYDFIIRVQSADRLQGILKRLMESRYTFGLMTKKNSEMKFLKQERKDCSDEDMNFFIDNIEKLFVVAYDGEGFIIWEKF